MTAYILETKRLQLRPFLPQDGQNLLALNADPEVLRYTGDRPFASLATAKEFVLSYSHYQQHGFGRWAVLLKSSDEFLGWCGFKRHSNGGVDLGYRLLRQHWGKGYATEAAQGCLTYGFEQLKLTSVFSRAAKGNLASVKVMQKLEMDFWKTEQAEGLGEASYYQMHAPTFKMMQALKHFDVVQREVLLDQEKIELMYLWNQEYPTSIRHNDLDSLSSYLKGLSEVEHCLLKTKEGELIAWFARFMREGKHWFGMMVSTANQGRGIGRALLHRAQKRYPTLHGWVIDQEGYVKGNGDAYRIPLSFYQKNGFEVIPEQRLENKALSAVLIHWRTTNKRI